MNMKSYSQAATFSLTLLSIFGANASSPIRMTPEQLEFNVNTEMAMLRADGTFAQLAKCSNKSEEVIANGYKALLPKCLTADPASIQSCYFTGIQEITGLSKTQLEICEEELEPDSSEQIELVERQLEELNLEQAKLENSDELSEEDQQRLDSIATQIDELNGQLGSLYDAQESENVRDLEIMNAEMRKINKTLEPLEKHEVHNLPTDLEQPWTDSPPSFAHLPENVREAKRSQWVICSHMTTDATLVAETIGSVKRQPRAFAVTDEQNQQQLRALYSASHGTFLDQIDNKIMEIGLKQWQQAHTTLGTHNVAKMAWEWCQAQPSIQFVNLDDSRL